MLGGFLFSVLFLGDSGGRGNNSIILSMLTDLLSSLGAVSELCVSLHDFRTDPNPGGPKPPAPWPMPLSLLLIAKFDILEDALLTIFDSRLLVGEDSGARGCTERSGAPFRE